MLLRRSLVESENYALPEERHTRESTEFVTDQREEVGTRGSQSLASQKSSGAITAQSAAIVSGMLLANTLTWVASRYVLEYLTRPGTWNGGRLYGYELGGWLVGLMLLAATGYLTGRFAARKARLIAIPIACTLFCIATTAYHFWQVQQYAPAYLHHPGPIYWLQKAAILITSIVTQIAVAEFFARRKTRHQIAIAQ